jgi:hypothetical protein
MNIYHTIEEVEKKFMPDTVDKYPVVLRIRVTQEESDTINDWVNRMHGYYAIPTGCI